jgi:hypothetical protein
MNYIPVSLCCAVVLIMFALAPGCGCFEDAVEDVTEDVIDTIIDEFFPTASPIWSWTDRHRLPG